MDRDEFLKEIWAPFPVAREGWVDVSRFLTSSSVANESVRSRVCGRLRFPRTDDNGGEWRLEAGGASLLFAWAPVVAWLQEQRRTVPFAPKLMRDGDLLCLELAWNQKESSWYASGVLLLVPCRAKRSTAPVFTVDRSKQWASFLNEVRTFFGTRGFIEARTPTLVPSPGTEPFLDPFKTEWELGSIRREYFLPTSPEFHLKKMLVRGWTRVFEFKTCFRNGEISEHHQPEFLMLEWYRAYSNLDAIADDVEELLNTLTKKFSGSIDVPRLKRTTMAELFARSFNGFVLRPETSRDELVSLASGEGIEVDADDSWDDVFFRIFLERIERDLGKEGPLLVRGYPPSQAALSRIGADGFADRFEVYWQGLELANAFHELNDPAENEARFREDARKKVELGKEPVPVDEELIEALWQGMPPSGGIALGLDRFFMALFGISTIAASRAFPARAPQEEEQGKE